MCASPLSPRHAQPDWMGGGLVSRQMMHAPPSAAIPFPSLLGSTVSFIEAYFLCQEYSNVGSESGKGKTTHLCDIRSFWLQVLGFPHARSRIYRFEVGVAACNL